MWSFIAQSGFANATVDFTNDLSLLLVSLVGLVWVSVGMIAFEAVRHYLSEKARPLAEAGSAATAEYQEAA
jgi:hypothetical protein